MGRTRKTESRLQNAQVVRSTDGARIGGHKSEERPPLRTFPKIFTNGKGKNGAFMWKESGRRRCDQVTEVNVMSQGTWGPVSLAEPRAPTVSGHSCLVLSLHPFHMIPKWTTDLTSFHP